MASATGGFVYRSERVTLEPQSTSGQNVGPGTYNVAASPCSNSMGTGVGSAPVPFMSNMERVLMENTTTSMTTPGPGAYQADKALDVVQRKHAESINYSAPFASLTARLHTDKTHSGKPGPGAYSDGNAWLKHQHRYTAAPTAQRVNFSRVASAPSIPHRHQCYGYEEGQQGSLVMQPPPDPIHTGVGRDTVGPGAYDVLRTSVDKPRAVQFGNSHTRRGLQVTSTTPGPGQYDTSKGGKPNTNGIVVTIAGVDVQFGGASGSSQFASKVPIPAHKQVQEWDRTPGPGAYNLGRTLGSAPLPSGLQFFGSSARRGSDIDPMRSLAAPTFFHSPGPAAYSVPPQGIRIMQQSMSDPRPFNQTSSRFASNSNAGPGPGEYRPDLNDNLAKALQDKAAISKGGVFGSAANRWGLEGRQQAQAAKLPGPGNYSDYDPAKPAHKGNDSVFASKTKRFMPAKASPTAVDTTDAVYVVGAPEANQVRGDPARLGPGSYSMPDQWKTKNARHSLASGVPGFGSNANRSEATKQSGTAANNPGPGRYNTTKDLQAALKPLTVPSKESVFGSQVSRFKGPGSFTPGPGQYAIGADLGKKTFNITYSGVAA